MEFWFGYHVHDSHQYLCYPYILRPSTNFRIVTCYLWVFSRASNLTGFMVMASAAIASAIMPLIGQGHWPQILLTYGCLHTQKSQRRLRNSKGVSLFTRMSARKLVSARIYSCIGETVNWLLSMASSYLVTQRRKAGS